MPTSSELAQFLTASQKWSQYLMARESPLVRRIYDQRQFDGEELVVGAGAFFPHEITQGYSDQNFSVVDKFNRVRPRNIKHFIEMVRDCKDEYCVFEFAGRNCETYVFKHEALIDSTDEVLNDNGIRSQASPDLLEIWETP